MFSFIRHSKHVFRYSIFIAFFFIIQSVISNRQSYASHSMGVDLTYMCLGNNVYVFTLSFYRDCSGVNAPVNAIINISSASCGQNLSLTMAQPNLPVEISALCPSALSTCQGGTEPGTEQYIYTDTITLPADCPDWIFSWTHCCRNPLITNLTAPSSQSMYIEATLNNTGGLCNSSPFFTTLPVPYICAGNPYGYNHGAVDFDGDSLVYTLVNPLTTGGVPIGYQPGYSPTYPVFTSSGVVFFDPQTGQMNLNNPILTVYVPPDSMQVAVVTVLIEEYRDGVLIGSTMRDIQVIVLDCGNGQPALEAPGIINLNGATLVDTNIVEVCVGSALNYDLIFSDPDVGDVITLTTNLIFSIPGATFTSTGTNPITGTFSWTPNLTDLGFNSYTVTIQDDGCPVLGSQTYVFVINVILGTYAGPDKFLCIGDTVQLSVGGGTSFTWTPSTGLSPDTGANPLAFPIVTTTYTVTSNLGGACGNVDDITVFVVPDITPIIGPDQILCFGGSTQLFASATPADNYIFQWSPSAGLDNDTIPNPIATPSSSTTYTVTITSPSGCTKTESVTITVSPAPLFLDPDADNTILCAGDITNLHANVSTGSCDDYVVDNIPFSPVAGSGTIVSLGDDASSPALNIGFNFRFFCNVYSQFFISSNGYLAFGSGSSAIVAQTLPNPTAPNNLIAFAWTDLDPGPTPAPGGGTVEYFTVGVSPNRILVMNFIGVPHYPGPSPNFDITTQVLLYETNNWIEIHTTDIPSNGLLATQGIEDFAGGIGFPVPSRNNTTWSASNDGVRFTPTLSPFTITWFDADSNIVGTDSVIAVSPDSTTTYTVIVTDGVCIDTKSITIDVTYVEVGPDTTFCLGDSVQLYAAYIGPTGSMAPDVCGLSAGCLGTGGTADYVVGTSFSTNSSTVYPAPYGNWYRNAKHQILYTVADLSAAGVVPGMIEAIGFNVAVINGTNTYYSYSIKIGTTGLSNLTNWQTGLQTVFTPKTVNVTTGWNVHTLDFPYDWDGSCNLIIELCYDNLAIPYTLNSSTYYTTTGFTSVLYYRSDFNPACPYIGGPSTSSNRPNTQFTICTDSITPVFTWTPSLGLSDDSVANPYASPPTTTTYIVTVDNGICTMSDTVTISPDSLTFLLMITNASCSGECDGVATAVLTNGTPPIIYQWDDPNLQTTATADSLCPGTYGLIAVDANGCLSNVSAVIQDGGTVASTISTNANASCFGVCDAEATVTVSGGTLPYTYLWNDSLAQTDSIATGLCAGLYYVTITDSDGCSIIDSVLFTQPSNLITQTTTTCFGACDGVATVTSVGGVAPYTYLWDDPLTQNTATADSLCAGLYSVTVTDGNGCVVSDSVIITAPTTATIQTDPSCVGVCDATASVIPIGGTPPFTYFWDTGDTTQAVTGLCPGTYNIVILDANSCNMSNAVTIISPDTLVVTMSAPSNVSCNGFCDGSATVIVSGGAPPYFPLWDDTFMQTTLTATGLCPGTYEVLVTAAGGCADSTTVVITEPMVLLSAVTDSTQVTCADTCDGDATITAVGGTPPYLYLWDDPDTQTTQTAVNLCVGPYNPVVIDVNGCVDTSTVTITGPTTLTTQTAATCFGICDGDATVTPIGGTPPYTYQWSDPDTQTTDIATGLCGGTYTVIVTDANGCIMLDVAIIVTPTSQMSQTDAPCFGICEGTATVTPINGSPPFTYLWDDSLAQTTATADSLCVTTYHVTITDANGCAVIDSVIIGEASPLGNTSISTDVTCNGVCDGTITVTPSEGNPPYTYQWISGQTTPGISGLCAGTYDLIITDSKGCLAIVSVPITEPNLLLADITDSTNVKCNGTCDGSATVITSGGTLPYTYVWDDPLQQSNSIAINLCPGTYTVTVLDANSCSNRDSVTITVPEPLKAVITDFTLLRCEYDCDAMAIVTPEGGIPPYAYLWNDPLSQTDSTATGLCFETYIVKVTDFNGCELYVTNEVDVMAPLPVADFIFIPEMTGIPFTPASIINPTILFYDTSYTNIISWEWDFGDGVTSDDINPIHTYSDTEPGTYNVLLIVENNLGCLDTIIRVVIIIADYQLFAPNAFTPDNNDLINDTWFPQGFGIDSSSFEMYIYNRWGDLIFETNDINKGWDGRANNGRKIAPQGVYVWLVLTKDLTGYPHEHIGRVTLIR